MRFVQVDKPNEFDLFDLCYVYVMFIDFHIDETQISRLKYVIRAEKFDDVFAIKFYASRDRKSIYDKYSLAHSQLNYKAIMEIFQNCLYVMKEMSERYPGCSFVFKGAESFNPKTKEEESEIENQRFRIYRTYLTKRIGDNQFLHTQYPLFSLYLLTNKASDDNPEQRRDKQMKMLLHRFKVV